MVKDHKDAIELLHQCQDAERDSRRMARESEVFLFEEGGQWEDKARRFFKDRPRYQMDHVYPIYGAITNDLREMDFAVQVVEAGNGARSEIAKTYDGMIRSIQNLSSMDLIKGETVDDLGCTGFDAWRVRNDWADGEAFDQDLIIERIPDAINRVWVGPSEKADFTDIPYAFVVTRMPLREFEETYPDKAAQPIQESDDVTDWRQPDQKDVAIAEYYCIKKKKTLLHLLSNDKVVKDEDYQKVKADYDAKGITIVRTRSREISTCYVRTMSGAEWLSDEQELPFSYVPVVPIYANYKVKNGRRIFFGVIEKLKDAQRVYNYAASREVSDGALAPVEKIAVTTDQVAGHEEQNSTLNNANDPLFIYNADPASPPPFKMPGSGPNPNLQIVKGGAAEDIKTISSQYDPAQGKGLGASTSGKAYEILNSRSNLAVGPYVFAMKRAVRLLGKILIDGIPKVYDTRGRQVRLMNEDGSSRFEPINDEVYGPNGSTVVRDLSQGQYDVFVAAGKGFASRKTEGVKAILEMGQVYPPFIEMGADIIAKSIDAPYVEQLAERFRKEKIDNGMIPESQLTDEERQKIMQEMERAAQQGPSALEQVAIAESQKIMMEVQEKQQNMLVQMMEQQRKMEETAAKMAQIFAQTQKTQAETVRALTESEKEGELPGNAGYAAANQVARQI